MFYEPWFLFHSARDDFWLVPRRAVVDTRFSEYQSFLDFFELPFFRVPVHGAQISVDIGDERAQRLASCMAMPEPRSVTQCGLLFVACERQEVMDFFQTCLTLALSSAHSDTDDPEFIRQWLEREDQDDVAKSLAATPDMSERMSLTTNRLRSCSGSTLLYEPADDSPSEMWLVPTDQTPVKFYPTTNYSTIETAKVQLKL